MRYLETLRRIYWTGRLADQGEASLIEKLRWWYRGFRPVSARQYGFPRADMHHYVNDYAENYASQRFNPVKAVFDHKAVQYALLQAAGAILPELMAILYRDRAALHPLTPRAEPATASELERALLADGGEFIIKPDRGGGGDKVALIRPENGKLIGYSGRDRGPFRFDRTSNRVMLVERRATQAGFWRDLYPGSLNTIRFLTLWRESEPTPFIAGATQRIGSEASAPADNHARGGLAAPIDAVTGRLGCAYRKKDPEERLTHHPDTGSPITGMVIPDWAGIRTEVLRLAGALPLNCFVGWDVFVNDEGRAAICEMNGHWTGVLIMQLENGLLADERVRRYYEEQRAV